MAYRSLSRRGAGRTRNANAGVISRGFTLVELLVVIVVIGILAAVAIPVFLSQADKASDTALKSDLANAAKLLQVAEANGETLPAEITAGQVVDLGSAGTFTPTQTLTVTGSGEALCVEGTSDSGTTYSADLDNGVRDYNCADIRSGALSTDGLVLHFDAADPKSYPGTGNTWFDLSGQGNHGTIPSEGVVFDGESMVFNTPEQYWGNYVTVADDDSLDLPSEATITMWMHVDAWQEGLYSHHPLRKGNSTANANYVYYLGGWYYSEGLRVLATDEVAWRVIAQARPVLANQWISTTWTFNNGENRLYFDGELVASNTSGSTLSTNSSSVQIGGPRYTGRIPVVMIYDRALTGQEIADNFDAMKHRFGG